MALGRAWPFRNKYIDSLLRRNYYQVLDTTGIYAVTRLRGDSIQGGTAWAVQMGLNLMRDKRPNASELPIYVFDMECNLWKQWTIYGWMVIKNTTVEVPLPTGRYTAIGSREMTLAGTNAIQEFFSPLCTT
jgi:hypothetical protein